MSDTASDSKAGRQADRNTGYTRKLTHNVLKMEQQLICVLIRKMSALLTDLRRGVK